MQPCAEIGARSLTHSHTARQVKQGKDEERFDQLYVLNAVVGVPFIIIALMSFVISHGQALHNLPRS